MHADRIVASVCAWRELPLDEIASRFVQLGYTQLECFSRWTTSALDERAPAAPLRARLERTGLRFHSLHLPPVTEDFSGSLPTALRAVRFAADLGMRQVVLHARTRELFQRAAPALLDAAHTLGLTVLVELHSNTAVANLADLADLFARIPDPRLHAVLEVGHLHKAGHAWREGIDALGARLACVHLKDLRDGAGAGWGRGEIDLAGIVGTLLARDYVGPFVVEIMVNDADNTELYLAEAWRWLRAADSRCPILPLVTAA